MKILPISKVTFTPEQLQARLPAGYRLLDGKHPFVGTGPSKRIVPFYVNLLNLDARMIRERYCGRNISDTLYAPAFRIDAPKGSVARSARIRKIEMRPRQFDSALSSNETLLPFAAAKAKDGKIVLRALNIDDSGPQRINWSHISRGEDNQRGSPASFNNRIDRELKDLPKESNVLVVGAGFGKSVLEYRKAHPGLNVIGLDVHDWVHALKSLDDVQLRKKRALVRRNFVLADAAPNSSTKSADGKQAHHLPFKDKSIDLVIMHPCVFMYLKNPLHSLRDLFRITKDKGHVIGDFGGSDVKYFLDEESRENQLGLPEVLEDHFGAKVNVLEEGLCRLFLSILPGNHSVPLPDVKEYPNEETSIFAVGGKLPGGSIVLKNNFGKKQ